MNKYFYNVQEKYSIGWKIRQTESKTIVRMTAAFCAPEDQFDKKQARIILDRRLATSVYKKYNTLIIIDSTNQSISECERIVRNYIYANKWIRKYTFGVDQAIDIFYNRLLFYIQQELQQTFRCDKFDPHELPTTNYRTTILSRNPFKILFYKLITHYYEWSLL